MQAYIYRLHFHTISVFVYLCPNQMWNFVTKILFLIVSHDHWSWNWKSVTHEIWNPRACDQFKPIIIGENVVVNYSYHIICVQIIVQVLNYSVTVVCNWILCTCRDLRYWYINSITCTWMIHAWCLTYCLWNWCIMVATLKSKKVPVYILNCGEDWNDVARYWEKILQKTLEKIHMHL